MEFFFVHSLVEWIKLTQFTHAQTQCGQVNPTYWAIVFIRRGGGQLPCYQNTLSRIAGYSLQRWLSNVNLIGRLYRNWSIAFALCLQAKACSSRIRSALAANCCKHWSVYFEWVGGLRCQNTKIQQERSLHQHCLSSCQDLWGFFVQPTDWNKEKLNV